MQKFTVPHLNHREVSLMEKLHWCLNKNGSKRASPPAKARGSWGSLCNVLSGVSKRPSMDACIIALCPHPCESGFGCGPEMRKSCCPWWCSAAAGSGRLCAVPALRRTQASSTGAYSYWDPVPCAPGRGLGPKRFSEHSGGSWRAVLEGVWPKHCWSALCRCLGCAPGCVGEEQRLFTEIPVIQESATSGEWVVVLDMGSVCDLPWVGIHTNKTGWNKMKL